MLELKVGQLLEINERLVIKRGMFEGAEKELRKTPGRLGEVNLDEFRVLRRTLEELEPIAAATDLPCTAQSVSRFMEALATSSPGPIPEKGEGFAQITEKTAGTAFLHLMDILSRLRDECSARLYYQINPDHAEYLADKPDPLFGRDVFDAFQSTDDDICEAAKCLALSRNTACAFHLMRAMEEALRSLATKIGADVYDTKKDQFMPWGQIVGNVKSAIPLLPKDQQDDWTQAHNLLWGVNKAWRNKTMHPAKTYTDEQIKILFDAVRNFMIHLAPLMA